MNGIPPVFVLFTVLDSANRKVVVTPRIVTDAKILILYSKTPGTVPEFCQGYIKNSVFYIRVAFHCLIRQGVLEEGQNMDPGSKAPVLDRPWT